MSRKVFNVTIEWMDSNNQSEGCIFATGPCVFEKDENADAEIFFYIEDEEDLKSMMNEKNCGSEFKVISYEEIKDHHLINK